MSFAQTRSGAVYARVAVESGVQGADPHGLILMLFEGALVSIERARGAMLARDARVKGESVSRAIQIVEQGLRASLDDSTGGDLAHQLRALYDYILERLLLASARNDPAGLDEAARLLGQLRQAWEEIPASARAGSMAAS